MANTIAVTKLNLHELYKINKIKYLRETKHVNDKQK